MPHDGDADVPGDRFQVLELQAEVFEGEPYSLGVASDGGIEDRRVRVIHAGRRDGGRVEESWLEQHEMPFGPADVPPLVHLSGVNPQPLPGFQDVPGEVDRVVQAATRESEQMVKVRALGCGKPLGTHPGAQIRQGDHLSAGGRPRPGREHDLGNLFLGGASGIDHRDVSAYLPGARLAFAEMSATGETTDHVCLRVVSAADTAPRWSRRRGDGFANALAVPIVRLPSPQKVSGTLCVTGGAPITT